MVPQRPLLGSTADQIAPEARQSGYQRRHDAQADPSLNPTKRPSSPWRTQRRMAPSGDDGNFVQNRSMCQLGLTDGFRTEVAR